MVASIRVTVTMSPRAKRSSNRRSSRRSGPRALHSLAVDVAAAASRRPKLLKLGVKRLPVGADAGIADSQPGT